MMRKNNFFSLFLLMWVLPFSAFATECKTVGVEVLFEENEYVFMLKNIYSPLKEDVRGESKRGTENEMLSYPAFAFLYSFKGDFPEGVNGLTLNNLGKVSHLFSPGNEYLFFINSIDNSNALIDGCLYIDISNGNVVRDLIHYDKNVAKTVLRQIRKMQIQNKEIKRVSID